MKRLAVFLGLCAVGACKDSTGTTKDPVVIGSLLSRTGDLAGQGQDFADATTLALEEINAQGGVLGTQLQTAIEDDGTTASGAKVGYSNLIAKRVPVVVGPSTSGQVVEIADLIKSSGVLTIAATATSPALTTLDDGDFFFRVAPSDIHQGRELVEKVITTIAPPAVKNLCIIYRDDAYGSGLAGEVKKRTTPLGIATITTSYAPDAADLSGVMKSCTDQLLCATAGDGGVEGGADGGAPPSCTTDPKTIGLLFLTFVADGAVILDSAYKLGWSADKQRFFFSDGARDQGILGLLAVPQMLEGALGTAPSGPDPGRPEGEQLRQLQNKFKARFNRSANLFIENIYDAVYIATAAIELAGTATSAAAVRDAVRKLQDPNGRHVQTGDWKGIKDLIAQKQPLNLDGASGSLDFDANGDVLPPYYYSIWTVKDGTITNVRVDTITP